MYWAAAAVGNWATRFYKYIRVDVEEQQIALELPLLEQAVSTRHWEWILIMSVSTYDEANLYIPP